MRCCLLAAVLASARAISISVRRNATRPSMGLCGAGAQLRTSQPSAAYFWSNKNGDATCSGASRHVAPSKLTAGPSWSFKDESASIVSTHPCIDGERNIYLSHRNGMVRKFSPSGQLLWQNRDMFAGQPAQTLVGGGTIKDGSLYVGFASGHVLSIDMETGHQNWKVKALDSAGPDSWSLVSHNGLVITVGRSADYRPKPDFGGNNVIAALDTRDGSTVWTFRPEDFVYNFIGSFVDGPPSVVFSDNKGVPHRLALCDGTLLWRNSQGRELARMTTGGAIVEPSGGRVFVTGNVASPKGRGDTGTVTAYDVRTGTQLWRHDAGMPANNAPVVGNLHGGTGKASVVVAIGANPSFPDPTAEALGHWKDGRPVAWNSSVYALDTATGALTGWEFSPPTYRKPQAYGDHFPFHICLPDAWSNAAINGDGTVFIGHMSGRIFALRDVDGDSTISGEEEVSQYFGGRCYQGSPGLAPGMLVATPCDGMHVFTA